MHARDASFCFFMLSLLLLLLLLLLMLLLLLLLLLLLMLLFLSRSLCLGPYPGLARPLRIALPGDQLALHIHISGIPRGPFLDYDQSGD